MWDTLGEARKFLESVTQAKFKFKLPLTAQIT